MTKTIRSDKCRCCGSGEQQPRHRLFVKCSTWTVQIKEPRRCVGKACEWKHPRAPNVRLPFRDERAAPAVLRETKVGRMVTLPPREDEWEDPEENLEETAL